MHFKTLKTGITPLLISAFLLPNFAFGQKNQVVNLNKGQVSVNETVNLPQYVRDLTEEARAGRISVTQEYQSETDMASAQRNGRQCCSAAAPAALRRSTSPN